MDPCRVLSVNSCGGRFLSPRFDSKRMQNQGQQTGEDALHSLHCQREDVVDVGERNISYNGEIKMVDVAETDMIYMRKSPKGMCSLPTQGVESILVYIVL